MGDERSDISLEEQRLVQLYMELTGVTEANARSVYMLLVKVEEEKVEKTPVTPLVMPVS